MSDSNIKPLEPGFVCCIIPRTGASLSDTVEQKLLCVEIPCLNPENDFRKFLKKEYPSINLDNVVMACIDKKSFFTPMPS